jgi:hypothetical protein
MRTHEGVLRHSPSSPYQEVNARIRELASRADGDEESQFVCECDDPTCVRQVGLTIGEYDKVRSGDNGGLILAH